MAIGTNFKIGLIINPIAGLGSVVGLHGTDENNLDLAWAKGAVAQASARTKIALSGLTGKSKESLMFISQSGNMGGDALKDLSLKHVNLNLETSDITSSQDTKNLAKALLEQKVDLILFAGGDGTARDIISIVQQDIPILGIPCGVKMRSGVFANFLNDVSNILNNFVEQKHIELVDKEILDMSVEINSDYGKSVFHGVAKTVLTKNLVAKAKARTAPEIDLDFIELINELSKEIAINNDVLYLIGPGNSTKPIKSKFGSNFDTRGVDAVYDGEIIGKDLSESEILTMLSKFPNSRLIVGVIGGQGFLFGRGNQQLSGTVINRIGWNNVTVIASEAKILNLFPAELLVELIGFASEDPIPSHIKVLTSPNRSIVCRTNHCYLNKSVVDSESRVDNGKVGAGNG